VVADEVRKLAERSAKATGEIAELIKGIQDETMQAVEAMEKGTFEVETVNEMSKHAGFAIDAMMESTEEVMMQIASVRSAANRMTESSEKVLKAVDGIAAVAEQNTGLTQQVAASTTMVAEAIGNIAKENEQTFASVPVISAATELSKDSSEQIFELTQQIAEMSKKLDELVSSFNW
ncbi:MAG: methyl-accepting chemotaxis protein, partial [Actinomycetota bacterium]